MTPKYDLEERTAKFSENIIKFAKKIPKKSRNRSSHQSISKSRNKRRG